MNIDHGKTHWTEDEQQTLRSALREFIAANGLTQSTAAREAQISAATLSQFLGGNYRGDNQEVSKQLSRWLSAKHEEARVASIAPPEPTFTMTKTAESVLGVLRSAQALSDMGLVIGPPGIGKTAAARQYKSTTPRVSMVTASPAISGAAGTLRQLLESVNQTPRGRNYASKFELTTHARRVYGMGWLVVVDEAQHLQVEALEELRAIHDETGAGLVLMGNASVLSRIEGNERNPAFAQLFSRAGVRVKLIGTPPEDVDAVIGTMGIGNPDVVKVAQQIGAKDSLRVVVKTLRRAQMVANAARENLEPQHVRRAYAQLGGALAR